MAELEETERLHAQAERQEKEWAASLTQLEADRRLLAEAWARVERERIAYSSGPEPHQQSHAPGQGPREGAPTSLSRAGAPVAARSAPADSDLNHPIAQAILRQFQTLSSDVRRNAKAPRLSLSKEEGQNRETPGPYFRPPRVVGPTVASTASPTSPAPPLVLPGLARWSTRIRAGRPVSSGGWPGGPAPRGAGTERFSSPVVRSS